MMKEMIKQRNSFSLPKTFSEALLLASKQAEQIEKQSALLLEQKPKVEFFEAVTNSKSAIDMGQVAKVLDKDIGRNKLFEIRRYYDLGTYPINKISMRYTAIACQILESIEISSSRSCVSGRKLADSN